MEHIEKITAAKSTADLAEMALYSAVWAARADGVTWQAIGDALGVSRQAVQMRFCDKKQRARAAHEN